MSNIRGRGRGRGGVTSTTTTTSTHHSSSRDFDDDDFDEQHSMLRSKYSSQLATTKELFPDWSDEDILQAIQDANGDVETTILRISEGHAQQWGAVTKKKVKKEQPAFTPSQPSNFAGRGGFANARGRGGFGSS
ncbi:hypothetical protein BCR35DRAFT_96755 [Leucosporidium creatinivorum]|uniref:RNA polymerase II degradation factor 1 n=1 Tax=Leucosporidium creatinivorum TaxID=106004 RepID=A0A1Y2F6K3_9BASI|nr:hypothetical protein BCR35DRAFT_96755 [Leucosporidium creatinivorum]